MELINIKINPPNNKKLVKLILVLILLLVPALAGCLGTPVTKKSESDIPLNEIKIVPHVKTAYKNWNENWGDGETDTWLWVDVRNIGRSNQLELKCYLEDLPIEWELDVIQKACDPGNVEYLWDKDMVEKLYAQHTVDDNEDNAVTEEWHTEYETTIRLRIRINCGQRGGWDTDGDGEMDTTDEPNYGMAIKVGTFAQDVPYDFFLHVSNGYCGTSQKFQVYVVDEPDFAYYDNYNYPINPV